MNTLKDGTPAPPVNRNKNHWGSGKAKPAQWIPTLGFHACGEDGESHVPCLTTWDDDGVMVQHRCVEHHGMHDDCWAAYKRAYALGKIASY